MRRIVTLLFPVLCVLGACGDDDTHTPPDAGASDMGTVDLGTDAGPIDLGPPDLALDANCPDDDRDGYGAAPCGTDCDDADASRFPSAVETCDGDDEDCNDATVGSLDADGDGIVSIACCNTAAGGATTCGEDCNDAVASVSPLSPEVCNGVDDDCSGVIDDGVTVTLYRDADGDLYGDASMPAEVCAGTAGYSANPNDCDDANAMRYPGSPSMPCP